MIQYIIVLNHDIVVYINLQSIYMYVLIKICFVNTALTFYIYCVASGISDIWYSAVTHMFMRWHISFEVSLGNYAPQKGLPAENLRRQTFLLHCRQNAQQMKFCLGLSEVYDSHSPLFSSLGLIIEFEVLKNTAIFHVFTTNIMRKAVNLTLHVGYIRVII